MPTRGRPLKTLGERKPATVQYPYQDIIWSKFMEAKEHKAYIKHCNTATRDNRPPHDVYDYYLKAHPEVSLADPNFPPRDPHWQPPSLSVPLSTQPVPASTVVTDPASTPSNDTTISPLDDFTHGLIELLKVSHPTRIGALGSTKDQSVDAQSSRPAPARNPTRTPWLGLEKHPAPRPRTRSPTISPLSSRHTSTSMVSASPLSVQISSGEEVDAGADPMQRISSPSTAFAVSSALNEQTITDAGREASLSTHDIDDGDDIGGPGVEHDESVPMQQRPSRLSVGQRRTGPSIRRQIISEKEHGAASVSTSNLNSGFGLRPTPAIRPDQGPRSPLRTNRPRDETPSDSRSSAPASPALDANSGEDETSSLSESSSTLGGVTSIRRRAQDLASAALVPTRDVHRMIQTVTSFYCDCRDGLQHQIDAERDRFSLPELRRATGHDRCFPPRGESLPQPFDASTGAVTRADLDRLDFAQYLSTSPADQSRSKLRLRSTTVFPSPMEQNFHVTWDVDSVWIRLRELTDLVVPLELTYTAQRFLNIKGPQHVPAFSSDDFYDSHFHTTAHSVFAKLSFATCSARVYVFWPFMKKHNKTVLTDQDFGIWVDGVMMPALHILDSCAWQDHPKSFKDARARAQHRSEVQIGGARGQADIGYTLSSRFLPPLVHAMRQIVSRACETSPLFPFRSFSFVVIVHDLKRAFNAESPRLDALVQFRRALTATFHAEYLDSIAFLDRSFADFGVEYNIRREVIQPTTLLVRRTCLQHRFTTALLRAGGPSAIGIAEPQLYTTYSLHDAARGRVFLPSRAPASAVLPMIKGYDLHKHTCHTHFRHDYSSPFTLPHLDLLCLTDSLLRDIHQGIRGTFCHRHVAAIQGVFTQTLSRLEAALEAHQDLHTGVRIEPRISMRHLFGLLDPDDWPSTFDTSTLHPGRHHPYVFAVATADLNSFIRNYLQRMTAALAAQQFALFGPVPSWNSIVVRHRLGTTAVLLKIIATFFAGDQRIHYNLKAGKYESNKGSGAWLANEGGSVDLSVAALARLRPSVRVGLMMEDTIQRYGCYWLPDQLFDFTPRPQLKLHLVTRVTVARPRLLGKSRIEWSTPVLSRRTYEGDAVAEIIITAARRLKELRALPDEDANYLQYQFRRMRAWVILRPIVRLLAQAFFRYIASLTDKDPFFLPLEDNEFGVPFNALTYEAVTRLLGTEPILATPRTSKKDHGKASWTSRVRYMFDDTSDDQWQKTASYLVELRRWIRIFKEEQVLDCYIDLWRHDMGLLMRPYIWILPSYEQKTLFRMDRFDAQAQVDKRLRTRWHLPGVVVKHREPVMARVPLGSRGRRFQPTPGNLPIVKGVCERQRKDINPATLTRWTFQAIGNIDIRDEKARWQLIEQLIDTFIDFSQPSIEWFHDKINHSSHEAGYWVPFWACGEVFPADEMFAAEQTVEEHRASFEPDGGFYSFVEAAEDELDDVENDE